MTDVLDICRRAKHASQSVATLPSEIKDAALRAMADALENSSESLSVANAQDVDRARSEGTSSTLIDRLTLTDKRISGMAEGLRAVASQLDPVGEVVGGWKRP